MKFLNRDRIEFLVVDEDKLVTGFLSDYLKQIGLRHPDERRSDQHLAREARLRSGRGRSKHAKVDGISLITCIRQVQPSLPVVVFTGIGYEEERMHAALRAGANGYVSKHLPIGQLYCVLARMLATSRQRPGREARMPARSTWLGAA